MCAGEAVREAEKGQTVLTVSFEDEATVTPAAHHLHMAHLLTPLTVQEPQQQRRRHPRRHQHLAVH